MAASRCPAVNAFLANKWYLDAINEKLFVRGSRKLAREVLEVDAKVVDGVVNLTGLLTLGSGEGLKYLENRPRSVLCPNRVRRSDRPGGAFRCSRSSNGPESA